jgi:lipoate-protein ligase A
MPTFAPRRASGGLLVGLKPGAVRWSLIANSPPLFFGDFPGEFIGDFCEGAREGVSLPDV